MRLARNVFIFIISAVLLFTLFSCEEDDVMLERQFLFKMPIGKMEDQLFVQQFNGVNTLAKNKNCNEGRVYLHFKW